MSPRKSFPQTSVENYVEIRHSQVARCYERTFTAFCTVRAGDSTKFGNQRVDLRANLKPFIIQLSAEVKILAEVFVGKCCRLHNCDNYDATYFANCASYESQN